MLLWHMAINKVLLIKDRRLNSDAKQASLLIHRFFLKSSSKSTLEYGWRIVVEIKSNSNSKISQLLLRKYCSHLFFS